MRSLLAFLAILSFGCRSDNGFGDNPVPPVVENPPGLPIKSNRDVVIQVTQPQVDILWMIDNSCSMSNEQDDLTENFPSFMAYFEGSGLDYHVGVTSSDLSTQKNGAQGKLVMKGGLKWIDQFTENQVKTFEELAGLGTGGGLPERGQGAVYKCLEEKVNTDNAGFYREDANLATIIISDEPDFTSDSLITKNEFRDWYDDLKPDNDMRSFSAIVDFGRGSIYKQSVDIIGGIAWDLKDEDWPRVLELLGLQAAGFKREYFLSQLPIPETVEVSVETVGGAVIPFDSDQWVYDDTRNSITFLEFYPDALSKIRIDYELRAAYADGAEVQ